MHHIYLLARIYPYWAVPVAVVLGQMGRFFRRRKSGVQWSFWSLMIFFAVTTILWFVFRGDLYSDQWVRTFFE